MTQRLRHVAEVNPATPEFDRLSPDAEITFMPLEAVWADSRLDTSRTRAKDSVSTGYTRFRDGDVLVPKVTPTFQAGRSAVVGGLVGGVGAGSTELHVLRARNGNDARFLRYVALSRPFLAQGVTAFQGVAGLQRVPDEFIKNFPVQEFCLEEQGRIADLLDAESCRVEQAVQKQLTARSLLVERRSSFVLAQIGGQAEKRRRASDVPWVESLPARWESGKVVYFARMGSGHTPSRLNPKWWVDCTVPWVTTGEVAQIRTDRREVLTETRERLSHVGVANSSAEICPAGTVVLCRTAASAGYSAVMGCSMATSQDFATWTCGPRLDPYFLLWCLRAMRADLLGRLAFGSTHKTIYMPDLQSLRIPLPPIGEQCQIVGQIRESNNKVDNLIDKIDRQLGLLAERRQALITAAVTGQIDVSTARGVII